MRTIDGRPRRSQTVSLALAALSLVLLLLGLELASLHGFERARELSIHTAEVTGRLWSSLRLLTDAETAQRGFLLTGDPAYLEPFDKAHRQIPEVMNSLNVLLGSNPAQKAPLARLDALVRDKLSELGQTIDLEKAGQHEAALAIVKTSFGKRTMDEVRRVQGTMVRAADAQLAERTASAAHFGRLSFVITAVAAASLLGLGFLLHFIGRQLARREAAELRVVDLEHFAGRVAHDVRSPLESVNLAVELAKRHPGDEKTRAALDGATRTLRRVGTLVEDLLVFAGAGAPPAAGVQAGVRAVLAGVVEMAQPLAAQRGIAVELREVCATTVACSAGALTSMVSNLVDNAIKYIGERSPKHIDVVASTDGSTTRIEVRDTGPGVPRKQRYAIFDPYVRAPGSTTPGFGLGLATVRRLAEAHGGSVGVAQNVPMGSVFWIELPNVPGPESSHAPAVRHVWRPWAFLAGRVHARSQGRG
jgi:signal transduction histidine kinase